MVDCKISLFSKRYIFPSEADLERSRTAKNGSRFASEECIPIFKLEVNWLPWSLIKEERVEAQWIPPLQKERREETVFQNASNGGYVSSTLMEGVGLRMFHVNYPLVQ